MVKDLIINGSLIISFLFVAGQVFKNNPLSLTANLRTKITGGIVFGVLGSVLMLFAIHQTDVILIDMRYIALILATIYGGIVSSLVSAFIMAFSRVAFFGFHYVSIIAVCSLLVISMCTLMIMRISKWSVLLQYWLAILVSLAVIFITLFLLVDQRDQLLSIYLSYGLITIGTAAYAYSVGMYIQHSNELYRKYKNESKMDFLTGLYNVRQFDEFYNKQLNNILESKEALSILMIDIDYFKKVNDSYGHANGDLVLQQLAMVLRKTTRQFDIIARKGGEEFSILLLDCPHQRALEIAERIRSVVEKSKFTITYDKQINITISIGVATFPEITTDVHQLIHQADLALYSAKRSGRNAVRSAPTT